MKIKDLSKKITAFLFAFVLLISMLPMSSMAVTTVATIDMSKTGSLEIVKTDDLGTTLLEDIEYTIYMVAEIVQSDGTNSEVAISYEPVATLINSDFTGTIDANTRASVFDNYLVDLTATASASTDVNGKIEFTNLPLGIYLVVETSSPDEVVTTNNFLVSIPMSILDDGGTTTWAYDIVASPKNSVINTTIEKTITDGAGLNTTNVENTDKTDGKYSASLGDIISYQITAVLPSNLNADNINYTEFAITDTYPDVLDINTDAIVVKLGTKVLASEDYIVTEGEGSATGTRYFKVSLNFESDTWEDAAGETLTITYNATFITAALINTDYQNKVQTDFEFIFKDGKDDETIVTTDPDGEDPVLPITPEKPEPIVVTYSYTLTKVRVGQGDEDAYVKLEGAEFVIKDSDGNYLTYDPSDGWISDPGTKMEDAYVVTSASETGYVTFDGLAEGDYEIIEVKAPEGYSLLKESIPVSINVNTTGSNGNPFSQLDVVNSLENSWVLPATGEFGIYLFTIGGVILIAAAIILLSKNKKKNNA